MDKYTSLLGSLLFDSLMLFALVAAVVGLLIGLWLLLSPGGYNRAAEIANRSFSLRRALRPVEISRSIERFVYRHHKPIGLAIILGSIFTLYRTLFELTPERLAGLLTHDTSLSGATWVFQALLITLIITNLFAMVVGLVIHIRPSALKPFEAGANHWVSVRRKTRWLEQRINITDHLLHARPRTMGFFLTLLSAYLLFAVSINYLA